MLSSYAKLTSFVAVLAFVAQVDAHGYVLGVQGGSDGFGVEKSRVKDGDQDNASVFKDKNANPCGVLTADQKPVDFKGDIDAAVQANSVPTAAGDGTINLTFHQVNGGSDGGGPGTAEIDPSGSGQNFQTMKVTTNFGDGGPNSDHPMAIQVPQGTTCSGGSSKDVCLVRVTNKAGAGPFGSCFAVRAGGAGGGNANNGPAPTNNGTAPANPDAQGNGNQNGNGSGNGNNKPNGKGKGKGKKNARSLPVGYPIPARLLRERGCADSGTCPMAI